MIVARVGSECACCWLLLLRRLSKPLEESRRGWGPEAAPLYPSGPHCNIVRRDTEKETMIYMIKVDVLERPLCILYYIQSLVSTELMDGWLD
jgi:hypothetical protein